MITIRGNYLNDDRWGWFPQKEDFIEKDKHDAFEKTEHLLFGLASHSFDSLFIYWLAPSNLPVGLENEMLERARKKLSSSVERYLYNKMLDPRCVVMGRTLSLYCEVVR